MRNDGFNVGHLTGSVGIEMLLGAVVPSQHVAEIASTPTIERHTPTDGSVEPSLAIPSTFGCEHQCFVDGVDVRVGSAEVDAVCHFGETFLIVLERKAFVAIDSDLQTVGTGKGLAIACHRPCLNVERIAQWFETAGLVGSEVAIARKPLHRNSFHHGSQREVGVEAASGESPDGSVGIVQTSGIDEQFGVAPMRVAHRVGSHSFRVARLAEGSGIERDFLAFVGGKELDVAAIPRVEEEGERRAVAGFETILRVAAIECAREAVLAIHADERIVLWHVLQPSLRTALVVVVGDGFRVVAHAFFLRIAVERKCQKESANEGRRM